MVEEVARGAVAQAMNAWAPMVVHMWNQLQLAQAAGASHKFTCWRAHTS